MKWRNVKTTKRAILVSGGEGREEEERGGRRGERRGEKGGGRGVSFGNHNQLCNGNNKQRDVIYIYIYIYI